MAELAVAWYPAEGGAVWQARMNNPAGGQLVLTAYEVMGLWHASVEVTGESRWEFAPSPAASRQIAQEWAEARAEQMADEQ